MFFVGGIVQRRLSEVVELVDVATFGEKRFHAGQITGTAARCNGYSFIFLRVSAR